VRGARSRAGRRAGGGVRARAHRRDPRAPRRGDRPPAARGRAVSGMGRGLLRARAFLPRARTRRRSRPRAATAPAVRTAMARRRGSRARRRQRAQGGCGGERSARREARRARRSRGRHRRARSGACARAVAGRGAREPGRALRPRAQLRESRGALPRRRRARRQPRHGALRLRRPAGPPGEMGSRRRGVPAGHRRQSPQRGGLQQPGPDSRAAASARGSRRDVPSCDRQPADVQARPIQSRTHAAGARASRHRDRGAREDRRAARCRSAAVSFCPGHGACPRRPPGGRHQMGERRAAARPRARAGRSRRGDRARSRVVEMNRVLVRLAPALIVVSVMPGRTGSGAAPEELFVERAAAAGLAFTHVNGAAGGYYLPEVMGAGVALFDFDNDGDLDLFLVQGGALDGSGPATSRLFRNDLAAADPRRALRFTDVTARAGLGLRAYGMGAAVGDYDNDGYLDLFVTSFGPDTLYHNNGDGTFTDVTRQAGVSDANWSTSAAFVDYDRDGRLDLFVANYVDFTIAANQVCSDAVGARDYCGPRAYHPVPDRLYHNEGNGHFANATERAGVNKADGAGLGVAIGDYDGDGWIDLYVANDATPNQLWINKHDGTFADLGLLSGSAVNAQGNPEGSMGIASGDVDLDGDEDLFVTNIAGETSVLYIND